MGRVRLPIIELAVTAWREAFRAIGSMPVPAGVVCVLMLVLGAGDLLFVSPTGRGLALEVIRLPLLVMRVLFVTPLAIAVHRFVLLGEVTQRYVLSLSDRRFLRFFGFAAVWAVLVSMPSLASRISPTEPGFALAAAAIDSVLFIFTYILLVQTVILFPAIAIDDPNAAWRKAMRDTKGYSWSVLFAGLVVGLPIVVVYLPLAYVLFAKSTGLRFASRAILGLTGAVVLVFGACAYAAMASGLYRNLSADPGGPSRVPVGKGV
jgi:hypothetical protein